jgi:CBS domain-containing protein
MTPGVLTCTPDAQLRDVARMMARYRVHAIVVFGHDQLDAWGVLSDLDLVAAIDTVADAGTIAVSPVVTVTPDATLADAARLMEENQSHHLLVTSDAGLPVGVISTLDVVRAFAGQD